MGSEEAGQDCACYSEICLCLLMPLTLPFLGCVHLCIQDRCIKLNRQQRCRQVNRDYFDGKSVFVCGENNSVYIHYSLFDPVAAVPCSKQKGWGEPAEEKVAVVLMDSDPARSIPRLPAGGNTRRKVRFDNDTYTSNDI